MMTDPESFEPRRKKQKNVKLEDSVLEDMVPKQTPKRLIRIYPESNLKEAYRMVMEEKKSVRHAAEMFGVPRSTLQDRVNGRIDVDRAVLGSVPVFDTMEEESLIHYFITMESLGYRLTKQHYLDIATDYAVHLGKRNRDKPFSQRWIDGFVKRWPEMKSFQQKISKTPEEILRNYFNNLKQTLDEYGLEDKPSCIYSVSERVISLTHKPPLLVKDASQLSKTALTKVLTMLGGGNADGASVPPYFLFQGKQFKRELIENGSPGVGGSICETGLTDSLMFQQYLEEHFLKFVPVSEGGRVLLLVDGHSSHVSVGVVEWARQKGIIISILPAQTSHALQPVDVTCYESFHEIFNTTCISMMRECNTQLDRNNICSVASKAYTQSFTKQELQNGFTQTGVYPFNADCITSDDVLRKKPKPKPKARTLLHRNYPHSLLKEAYNMVKEGKMSARFAAKAFAVPLSTLQDRLKGKIYTEATYGSSTVLEKSEEKILVNYFTTIASSGYVFTRQECTDIATEYAVLIGKRGVENPFTLRWLDCFLKRWPEMNIFKQRCAKIQYKEIIRDYFDNLSETLTGNNLTDKPHLVYNISERVISYDGEVQDEVNEETIASAQSDSRNNVTVIGGGSVVGACLPPYFVLPDNSTSQEPLQDASPGSGFTVSETGLSSCQIFKQYIEEHFLKYIPNHDNQKVLLLFEGHQTHLSVGVLEWALEKDIILYIIPSNTGRVLQPTDVLCNVTFVNKFNTLCNNHMDTSGDGLYCKDICAMASKAYIQAFTPDNIQTGFKQTGIYPLNSDVLPSLEDLVTNK